MDISWSRKKLVVFFSNVGGPYFKPKYFYIADSEQVLWRKNEKNSIVGCEKILKPDTYNQLKCFLYDSLPFVSCISDFKTKASLNY